MKSFRETKRSLRDLVNVPSGFDYSTLWFSFPCAEKKWQIIKRQPTNTWCSSTLSPIGDLGIEHIEYFNEKKNKKRITLPILWLWKIGLFLRVRFKKFIWFFRGVFILSMINLQSIPGNSDNCSITHNHFFLKICVNLNTSHSTRAHFTLYYTLYTLYTKLKISAL